MGKCWLSFTRRVLALKSDTIVANWGQRLDTIGLIVLSRDIRGNWRLSFWKSLEIKTKSWMIQKPDFKWRFIRRELFYWGCHIEHFYGEITVVFERDTKIKITYKIWLFLKKLFKLHLIGFLFSFFLFFYFFHDLLFFLSILSSYFSFWNIICFLLVDSICSFESS